MALIINGAKLDTCLPKAKLSAFMLPLAGLCRFVSATTYSWQKDPTGKQGTPTRLCCDAACRSEACEVAFNHWKRLELSSRTDVVHRPSEDSKMPVMHQQSLPCPWIHSMLKRMVKNAVIRMWAAPAMQMQIMMVLGKVCALCPNHDVEAGWSLSLMHLMVFTCHSTSIRFPIARQA